MTVGELERLLAAYPNKNDRVVINDAYHQTIDFIVPGMADGYDVYTEDELEEDGQDFNLLRTHCPKEFQPVCIFVLR